MRFNLQVRSSSKQNIDQARSNSTVISALRSYEFSVVLILPLILSMKIKRKETWLNTKWQEKEETKTSTSLLSLFLIKSVILLMQRWSYLIRLQKNPKFWKSLSQPTKQIKVRQLLIKSMKMKVLFQNLKLLKQRKKKNKVKLRTLSTSFSLYL